MTTMHAEAAVLYEIKKPLVVEDVEVLEPQAHEVLVRWVANGVCHSDYHLMTGDVQHPLPVVLGHEAAGVVEKIGAGVESVKPGDHVCSSYIPSCGHCGYCINGQPTLCALRDNFMDGRYKLRELISRRLPLKDVNHAYDLLVAGEVKRSVIVYEG
jgi:S-(hydroxymethyl)glutathione dehydrogenase/alcohol dehydrogenase